MSELVARLKVEGEKHRGTDLGGLLQWAWLHIASQDDALMDAREQFLQIEQDYKALQDGLNEAAIAVGSAAKALQAARPVDVAGQFARDYCGHINLMAGHGDADYLKKNGLSVRHVDTQEEKPRKKK